MSDYLDPNNEELLRDFFEEAQLQIDLMEQNILVLENDSSDRDSVDELFRAAHTLKGASATVQMDELTGFTHIVEDVLDEVRSDSIEVNESVVDIILTAIDVIKLMLEARSEGTIYDDGDDIRLSSDKLKHLLSGNILTQVPQSTTENRDNTSAIEEYSVADDLMSEYEVYELFESAGKDVSVYRVRVDFEEDTLMNTVGGIQIYSILKNLGVVLKTNPDFEELNEDIYHPTVFYYLATDENAEDLQSRATISDVTTGCHVLHITESVVEEIIAASKREEVEIVEETQSVQPAVEESTIETVAPEVTAEVVETSIPVEPVAVVEEKKNVLVKSKKVKKSGPKKEQSSILRVDSKKIDNLLNMVSESVINKSTVNRITGDLSDVQGETQTYISNFDFEVRTLIDAIPEISRQISEGRDPREITENYKERFEKIFTNFQGYESRLKKSVTDLKNAAQKLSINTGNMQEGIMKIRMVPISSIFSRFPRLVRDLSHSLGKSIRLELHGEDTELDKSVIEDLLDPLIHCVRNSIDHGIESPESRKTKGKPEEGLITLNASNEGSMILIEIVDDGGGINPDIIIAKAVERGLIPADIAISDTEVYDLLFEPGFSTAKKVTNVSGRGVGMDVVKTQIEKLKGAINVSSTIDKGTKISIRLPLTLAIIQGLLVRVGEEVYSIPVTSVVDSHRISAEDIRMVDSYEVFNVRDEVIFLVRMSNLFRIPDIEPAKHKYVVIVGSAERKIGLIVDALIGEEDVVIKPLKDEFSNTPGIAGATILGDGKVSLIIDVTQLLELGAIKAIESRNREDVLLES